MSKTQASPHICSLATAFIFHIHNMELEDKSDKQPYVWTYVLSLGLDWCAGYLSWSLTS